MCFLFFIFVNSSLYRKNCNLSDRNVGFLSAACCWSSLPRVTRESSGWYSARQCTVSSLSLSVFCFFLNWYLGWIVKLGLIWCAKLIGFCLKFSNRLLVSFGEPVLWFLILFCNVILLHFFGAETVILLENPERLHDYFLCLSSFLFSQFWFFFFKRLAFYIKKSFSCILFILILIT